MPGSSNRRAPFTNVWRANTVLPDPAGPASNVVRPRGNPPPVISSTPSIPVCAFDRRGSRSFWFLRAMPISVLGLYSNTLRQPQQDPRGGGQPMTRLTRRASLLVADGYSTVVPVDGDRKSTRLNSSHLVISYAVFCLKKKNLTHVGRTARARA